MHWHNVLFRLSALISRLPSLCSEDEANTQHFLVRCWITLSQCLFAASKVDPLSRLPLEHLIIHKGHSGMKSKAEGRRDERNEQITLQDKSARWAQIFGFSASSLFLFLRVTTAELKWAREHCSVSQPADPVKTKWELKSLKMNLWSAHTHFSKGELMLHSVCWMCVSFLICWPYRCHCVYGPAYPILVYRTCW